jgi:hypothetical protein
MVATFTTSVPKFRTVRSSCACARGAVPTQALAARTISPGIAFATDFIPHYFDMAAIPKDGTAANIKEPNPVI